VQVLTAEVRTLVVGSRQITMSVYEQLDCVRPDEIEPFGRVSPNRSTNMHLWVVGRHAVTGVLVSSYAPRTTETIDKWIRAGVLGIPYLHWRTDIDTDRQRQHLVEIAARWAELPLIVLAGLR
jgi:hypothetical protein